MESFRETILLDYKKFNENGYWDIPILSLDRIKVLHLFIDGKEIPPSQFTFNKNHLNLSGIKPIIGKDTKAELIVEFTSSNKKITFWLPIYLAILGLIGSIAQPILHHLEIIYKPTRILHIDNTAYEYSPDKLSGEISIYPIKEHLFRSDGFIPENELNEWELYIAATISNKIKDPFDQEYNYFSGPHQLQVGSPIPFEVSTDTAFTRQLQNIKEGIFRIITLVKKGTKINSTKFKPSEIPGIKIIGRSYYYPCEKMLYK